MKYLFLIGIVLLLVSCSGTNFSKRLRNDKNIDEVIAFKKYLQEINLMGDFYNYKIVELSKVSDPNILEFCKKYKIKRIYIHPCKRGRTEGFKTCGDVIQLYYNNMIFFEDKRILVFDYSKEELELVDGSPYECKIAENIFVF